MKKTKKLILAEWLESHQRSMSAEGVMALSNSENLGVQVKTLDSDGNFVIKFSASDPWIKPSEWLHNYKAAIKARYEEAAFVYRSLFPPEDSGMEMTGNSNFDSKAYGSLKSGLNIKEGDSWFRSIYPANMERFKSDVVNTIERYPGMRRIDTVLTLTIGTSALAGCQLANEVKEVVAAELRKHQ